MPSQSGVHAEVRATVAVTLLAVLFCLGCSAASFDEPKRVGGDKNSEPAKNPEAEPADQPQSVAGAYLVGCGLSDAVMDPAPTVGMTTVGCGVFDKTSKSLISEPVDFESVRFQDTQGQVKTVAKDAFKKAPTESGYHVLTALPSDFMANLKAVDGLISVSKKIYKGDFDIVNHAHDSTPPSGTPQKDAPQGSQPSAPPAPSSGSNVNKVPGINLVYPNYKDTFNNDASNLLDNNPDTPWNSGNNNSLVIKLSWPTATPISGISIIPDYGFQADNGSYVNTGNFKVKVEVGDSFKADGKLHNATEILSEKSYPVTRKEPLNLTPNSTPTASAAIITISDCGQSWCAAMEVSLLK